ncbi:MAG TPA: 23S rRNA (uracil(1939)-C(5))-methyltransferase RlmD [Bacteroidales bacterium]|nr:23S rRNA (uracil(1939)-C(5))-methyltransferase RlmD [Bacteroidales bacterium]
MKKKIRIYENLEITDLNSEGLGVTRVNEKVVFVKQALPHELVDVHVYKKKKKILYGQVIKYKKTSQDRVIPKCKHFGECGGCKLQFLAYEQQLYYKEKRVIENIKRIGKLIPEKVLAIMASPKIFEYRNKLEFTFSDKRWITRKEIDDNLEINNRNALGFHVAGRFDKVIDIDTCYLQTDIINQIRNKIRDFSLKNGLSFYNLTAQKGFLRNLIFRTTLTGELMLAFSFAENDVAKIETILDFTMNEFPMITTLLYFVNTKKNDSLYDIDYKVVKGKGFITEVLDGIYFKIGPKSFFQTNSFQILNLYRKIKELAEFRGNELVYDLYTGTGSIALFIARNIKRVIGVDSVPEAITDAMENAKLNDIANAEFLVGDMRDVFTQDFIATHGKPDVIIIDPPRAGMHHKVIENILFAAPEKIIYVSCNSSTQARDLLLMSEKYALSIIQPVDMFPQTPHIENIALLIKK